MKTLFIILVCLPFMFMEVALGQNTNKMSRKIRNIQMQEQSARKTSIEKFHSIRNRSKILNGFLPFQKSDTIFILEQVQMEYWGLDATYWNNSKQKSIRSTDSGKTYSFKQESIFSRYKMELISQWNIEEIRKEEKNHWVISEGSLILATKIIINDKKYIIDCFTFLDFVNVYKEDVGIIF